MKSGTGTVWSAGPESEGAAKRSAEGLVGSSDQLESGPGPLSWPGRRGHLISQRWVEGRPIAVDTLFYSRSTMAATDSPRRNSAGGGGRGRAIQ